MFLCLSLVLGSCGGGGSGMKIPAQNNTGGTGTGGTGTAGSSVGTATLYLDASTLQNLVSRRASAISCSGTPFVVSQGGLRQCQDSVSGPTAPTALSITAGGKTTTGTLQGAAPFQLKNLPAGQASFSITPPGEPTLTLNFALKADLTLHLRLAQQDSGSSLIGAYSGSGGLKLQEVDLVGFVKRQGEATLWSTDEGVTYKDMDDSMSLSKGDEVTFDQDMDGIDDEADLDDDNDDIPDTEDLDDDNDGIPDLSDTRDPDEDNDGVLNLVDSSDLDSDNDGIPDIRDSVKDAFISAFQVSRNNQPIQQGLAGEKVQLTALTDPPGATLGFLVSGGLLQGNEWTLPVHPGKVEAAVILDSTTGAKSRRAILLEVVAGSANTLSHEPPAITLNLNQTYPLNFKIKDGVGNILPGQIQYQISGSSLSLEGNGQIKAIKTGLSEVQASFGNLRGTLTVNVPDLEGPGVRITNQVPASSISPSVVLVGFVDDLAVKEVVVTGGASETRLPVTTGFFSGEIPLLIGRATLTVTATDAAGNTDQASVTTERLQDQLPQFTLDPVPSAVLGDTLILTGKIVDNNTWAVQISAELGFALEVYPLANGDFSASIPLALGTNQISLQATDEVGNSTQTTATTERRDGGLVAFTSNRQGQTVRPGETIVLTLQTQGLFDADVVAALPALGLTLTLKDDGQAPDLAVDGNYTGQVIAPVTGPLGTIGGNTTLTDTLGTTGTLSKTDLFSYDPRPVIGTVTCDCTGQTKTRGDVLSFSLSASAYPTTASATMTLTAPYSAVIPLTDADGDGQYTGTSTVPNFGSGSLAGTVVFIDQHNNRTDLDFTNLGSISNAPSCTILDHDATGTLLPGDSVRVRASCGQGGSAILTLKNGNQFVMQGIVMKDDGTSGDTTANDNIFETVINIPSCLEIPNGQLFVDYTDPFNNTLSTQVTAPLVVSAEPRLLSFTPDVSAGTTLRGGEGLGFSATAPEAGGEVKVTINPLGTIFELTDLGSGSYGGTFTLPLSGSTSNLDLNAVYTSGECPQLASDPIVLIDFFSIDNAPQLSNLSHSADAGQIKTGGESWTVSLEGPPGAASVSVRIMSSDLPQSFPLAETQVLSAGRSIYSATFTLPSTGGAEAADVRADFTDANGNSGILTLATSMTMDNTAPAVPVGLQATGGGVILLSWTRPSSDVLSYRIERRLSGGTYALLTNLNSLSNSVSYTDTTVDNINSLVYDYRVTAIDRVNLESPGAEALAVQATVSAPSLNRPIPFNDGGTKRMKLTWNFVSDDQISSIRIYRNDDLNTLGSVGGDAESNVSQLVFSGSVETFATSTDIQDNGPGGTFADGAAVYHYKAEIWTHTGGNKSGTVTSQSADALWQIYNDSSTPANSGLVRRLLGGSNNDQAGTLHYTVTAGMTGITAKSRLAVDNQNSVLVLSRPDAGAVSFLDFAGNLLDEVTGLSLPSQLGVNQDIRKVFVSVGSGPYSVIQLDYSDVSNVVNGGTFGTTVAGAFSTPTEPGSIDIDLVNDRVVITGVEAEPSITFSSSDSLLTTWPAVHGQPTGLTASYTFNATNDLPNIDTTVPVTVFVILKVCTLYPNTAPLNLKVFVNDLFVARTIFAPISLGSNNNFMTYRATVRPDFFKFDSTSSNTIRVVADDPIAQTYGGRLTVSASCTGQTAGWYLGGNNDSLTVRFRRPGMLTTTLNQVAIFNSSGTEVGYVSSARASGNIAINKDGDYIIPENHSNVGIFSATRDGLYQLKSEAFDYFAASPVYTTSNSPPIGDRLYFDLATRNDWGGRKVGITPSSGNTAPYQGWMNVGRTLFSDNGGLDSLYFLTPWYEYASTGSIAMYKDKYSLIRCNDPFRRHGSSDTGCDLATTDAGTNANPGGASWRADNLGEARALAHDSVNNRVFVCHKSGGVNALLVLHQDGDGSTKNTFGTPLDAATPSAEWRQETDAVGDTCEVVIAR